MHFVTDKEENGTTVVLDNHSFVRCKFTDCYLLYSGGDYAWTETTFNNCRLGLQGAAQRTAAFLTHFGWKQPQPDIAQSPNQTVH
jgi:hypothetical protein